MTKAECPCCNGNVNVGPKPRMGQRFTCAFCRTELEVVWLEPVELDFPFDEEDFEDDDSDDYDD